MHEYQRPSEEDEPNEGDTYAPVGRSIRAKKSNPKHANATIVEAGVKEPITFEETSKNQEWIKAMDEEIVELE